MATTDRLARRELLRRGLIWGGVGAAAASGVTVAAAPADARARRTLTFDVACLGDSFRLIWAPGAPESGDLRGSTFSVEGAIYPPGTIDGTGFDPAAHGDERIGTWFCRGWMLISGDRPEPHAITTQEYVLGLLPGSDAFPADQLV
ncbi:MAG: hypothetical protein M3133_11065, partial [Actinomycetota bacterium]|nr:hypothetical protein [Actinomycetota bacterium]